MKILFVGVFKRSSTSYSQAIAFENIGVEVIRYDYRHRAKVKGMRGRNLELIAIGKKNNVDAVLFAKCNRMGWGVVENCNEYAKTILWMPDTPGLMDEEFMRKLDRCGHTFCAATRAVAKGLKRQPTVSFLAEGFCLEDNMPMPEIEQDVDVSFIGNLSSFRRKKMRAAVPFTVLKAHAAAHSKAVARSKINLNFTTGMGTSDRTYKVLASKGFLLTEAWDDIDSYFVPGEHLAVFKGVEDLKQKIAYYLEHPEERERIAEAGYKEVQKYTREAWAQAIVDKVEELQ